MQPIRTNETNCILTAPKGYENDVLDLPVIAYNLVYDDKTSNAVSSAWQLTEDELKILNETKTIYLHFLGNSHPPVLPSVLNVNEQFGEELEEINEDNTHN